MQPAPAREGESRIYQADSAWCEQVRSAREKLSRVCARCSNRLVRVQTIDGHVYEGTVVGTSGSYLYLMPRDTRFFGPWAAGFILPLVLFDLLAITLLI
ncbi:hypothetical protein GE107_07730 [Cohnella sp. CFH 77786]|uniref:hypothetical protein n=1 Tax=Cohnella sp. CFH 77786 TaxID=2662265 RepID=UPI001C60A38F|nr:hypothetical protein [Cohnella sp. CFH 77786]MBW5445948.1 hypothetical protein [Cohnella sp. CFH 77786]